MVPRHLRVRWRLVRRCPSLAGCGAGRLWRLVASETIRGDGPGIGIPSHCDSDRLWRLRGVERQLVRNLVRIRAQAGATDTGSASARAALVVGRAHDGDAAPPRCRSQPRLMVVVSRLSSSARLPGARRAREAPASSSFRNGVRPARGRLLLWPARLRVRRCQRHRFRWRTGPRAAAVRASQSGWRHRLGVLQLPRPPPP
jgi:hypothetical protein